VVNLVVNLVVLACVRTITKNVNFFSRKNKCTLEKMLATPMIKRVIRF